MPKIKPRLPLTADIILNDLCAQGRNNRARLNSISCHFHPGEIIALIGPNGAGKTSLLQALSQQLPLQKGHIDLFGHPLEHWPLHQRAQHLALLAQKHQLNMPFAVKDVLTLARLHQKTTSAANEKIIRTSLDAFDAHDLYDRCYTELSGGEQQRVHLARTFAQLNALGAPLQTPALLLLDEPTAALDLSHQQHLVRAIRKAARNGLTVILSLHDLSLAAQLATRVLCLVQGEVKAWGSVSHVMEPALLASVFKTQIKQTRTENTKAPLLYQEYAF